MKHIRKYILLFTIIFSTSQIHANTNYFLGSGEYFNLSFKTDIPLISTGLVLNIADIVLDNVFTFKNQDYKNQNFYMEDVNSFDKWAMQPYSESLDTFSNITLGLALASPLVMISAPATEYFTIGTMFAESILIANGLKNLGKTFFYRARPYMYYENPPMEKIEENDWNKSFPSGHTTLAFTGAAFTSFVFSTYYKDSQWKLPVILSSYVFALSTGIFRICSGNHFFTDVLIGAVIGTSTGFLVPWLHTLNTNKNVNLSIAGNTVLVKLNF